MEVQQLQLDLWQSLEAASRFPETADLRSLCTALEQTITEQPLAEQLAVAGDVLMQLSEVYAARADLMFSRWERRHNPQEPVVDLEGCVDLFVQSLSLDVTDLFEEPEPLQYPANRKKRTLSQEGSVVGEVDKEALLNWADQIEQEQPLNELQMAEQIRELAHGESVEEWVGAIAHYLQLFGSNIRLPDLQQALKIPIVELWIGLLLGGYSLEQQGEFYNSQTLWITGANKGV
ncbi:hypothetical protein [Alkalinema sp. FACHB-956]|uniref:hypothetical protein n=1 Tax=Alkalinema sp. FACHB-956 TaxID=2692768 RepID=UPI0016889824|nr:hypothetical protein [Alkalinema sp. FACHB-956]MBD2328374.1 hypothetical protein [Alkalinema sp. FACHB-956]